MSRNDEERERKAYTKLAAASLLQEGVYQTTWNLRLTLLGGLVLRILVPTMQLLKLLYYRFYVLPFVLSNHVPV
jgi:hypothetical protein